MKKIEHAVITGLLGSRVIGPSGEELGIVTEVFVDAASREPTFIEVDLGDSARQPGKTLVPAAGLQLGTGTVRSPYSRATLAAAPASADRLSPEDEARVLAHYEGQSRPSAGDAVREDTGSSASAGTESRAEEPGSAGTEALRQQTGPAGAESPAQDGRPDADTAEQSPGAEAQEHGTRAAAPPAGAVGEAPPVAQAIGADDGTAVAGGGTAEGESTHHRRAEPEQG